MTADTPSSNHHHFFERVYALVAQIPQGQVTSYGEIARLLGSPRAARQVGWAMRCCPDSLPWHRVVKADGTIAENGYSDIRRTLLRQEGVPFLKDGRVNMPACRWRIKDGDA